MTSGEPCAVSRELKQASPVLLPYVEQARQQVPAQGLKQLSEECYDEQKIKGPFKL